MLFCFFASLFFEIFFLDHWRLETSSTSGDALNWRLETSGLYIGFVKENSVIDSVQPELLFYGEALGFTPAL